ncbi:D-2-hydroxyacid dehydrogenase [Halanaerobaculum tunisiense]
MPEKLEILMMFDHDFTTQQLSSLEELDSSIKLTEVGPGQVTRELIQQAEVIFGWPKEEQLAEAKNLQWLHLPSAGASEFVDRDLYPNQDVILTNSSGVYGLPIAEHVFSLILAFNRNLPQYLEQQGKKEWQPLEVTKDLAKSQLGIIGLGDIGTQVAWRAHAWGARVVTVEKSVDQVPDYVDQAYDTTGLNQVLQESDYIVLALPITEETKGLIGTEELQLMKEDAFLVNVGRGGLIDQSALLQALTEGWIAGAGLDVTTPEPLPEDSPLWDLSNLLLTPHHAGSSPTNRVRSFNIFSENLKHYLQGEELENVVDFEEGY